MIAVEGVSKTYSMRHGIHRALNGVNFEIRKGERVGIIGRNGAGKSTLIRLLAGVEYPTTGRIRREMSVSWPLAHGGAFGGNVTGLDNLRFICRVYGVDHKAALPFVEDFTELGVFLREPVDHYSSGMRARLAFALSLVIEFDCFLIDEVIAVGDSRFHERCNYELFEKRRDRAIILVSHQADDIRRVCDRACVLRAGRLECFESIDDAYKSYESDAAH